MNKNNISSGTNVINESTISVGGDFWMLNIGMENSSIAVIKDLLATLEKIKEYIDGFDLNISPEEYDKKKHQIEREIKNYLIPKINSIKSNKPQEPDYIWHTNKDNQVRFWNISLKEQEENKVSLSTLEEYLKRGDFKSADKETGDVFIKEINTKNKTNKGWLSFKDIEKLPIELIYEIDQLWLFYSNQRFGITPQYTVWKNEKENFENFGKLVGWWKKGNWIQGHSDIQYSLNSPQGHLPTLLNTVNVASGMVNNWERLYRTLIQKIDTFFNQK